MEWKLFPRNAKVLYIPDPQKQMTPQQLSRYRVGAAAALNPIAIVPPPAAQPVRQRPQQQCNRQKRQRDNTEAQSPRHRRDESDHSSHHRVPSPTRSSSSRTVSADASQSDQRMSTTSDIGESSERTTGVEDYDSPEELRRRYEADQKRRVEYSNELTIAYCKAKEKLDTLNADLNMVVELGEDDVAATTFWASFDAALVEDRVKNEGQASPVLQFLHDQKEAKMGLTDDMLDMYVAPMLELIPCLNSYMKYDFTTYFGVGAIPNWREWDEVKGINSILIPKFVSENLDSSLGLLREWWNADNVTYGSSNKMTEETIKSMCTEYEKWSMTSGKPRQVTRFEEEYVLAKKEAERAKLLLRVHQISDNGLFEFRRFSATTRKTKIQFADGAELPAIRKMCQAAIKKQQIFSDFKAELTYISSDGDVEFSELGIVDDGGVTTRLLTGAWKSLFNGEAAVMLVGQLMFLLVLKKQLVARPMTMATVAHALGKVPSREEIDMMLQREKPGEKLEIYIEDF
ncbi:unnamed protein product [Calypogeia fissa]